MAAVNYTIKKNTLERSYISGFYIGDEDGRLYFDENTGIHRIYFDRIDSGENDSEWGRFSFKMSLPEDMVIYVYAAAYDSDTWYNDDGTAYNVGDILRADNMPDEGKKNILLRSGGKRYVGKNDILLYDLNGRYLFLAIEIRGVGEGYIGTLRVDKKGDNFMDVFPAVYKQRNSFFHRFLSVFSSIYNDTEYEISRLPELLNADTCPPECLPIYAGWLGIDFSGDFLSEDAQRQIVKEGYNLNKTKGTKGCLQRIIEIVTGEKVIILENNAVLSYIEKEDDAIKDNVPGGIYDVNILIRKSLSESDRHQLMYLLEQFKPIRTKLHLIQLKDTSSIDGEIYLDMNAVLSGDTVGSLDDDMYISEDVILEE